ncbi:MAG: FGGY family carbohydrate kinase [Planctomycetota bacterium]
MTPNSRELALAIDLGTTSVKTAAIDLDGNCQGLDVAEYSLIEPRPGFVEADPSVFWESLPRAISAVLDRASASPSRVRAISLSSQGQTFLCLDDHSKPLSNAFVWLDSRALDESRELLSRFGRETFYRHTGGPTVFPGWTASLLLWLRNHEAALFRKASRFSLLRDYIALRACGCAVLDETGAVSSGLYSIPDRRWWPDVLSFLDLDPRRLPDVTPSGTRIGTLTPDAADFLGLSANTPLVAGAWDQVAAAVGSANLAPGFVTETTGTALAVAATTEGVLFDPKARLLTIPHASAGKGIILPFAPTSGIVLKWFRENLSPPNTSYDDLTAAAASSPVGARGLLFIPHFEGTASPDFNPAVSGAIAGLRLHHSRADLTRALLESLAFVLRELLDVVKDLHVSPRRVTSLGGGAKSALLCQIKADVLGLPVQTLAFPEAALLGAAMLAFTGVGLFDDLPSAARAMVRPARLFEPDPANRGLYEETYSRYRSLFTRLYPAPDKEKSP